MSGGVRPYLSPPISRLHAVCSAAGATERRSLAKLDSFLRSCGARSPVQQAAELTIHEARDAALVGRVTRHGTHKLLGREVVEIARSRVDVTIV